MPALSAQVCSADTAVTKLFFASSTLPLFAEDSSAPMPCASLTPSEPCRPLNPYLVRL